jgi:hypothetical protein
VKQALYVCAGIFSLERLLPQVTARVAENKERRFCWPATELIEFVCNENNRDLDHLPGNRLP